MKMFKIQEFESYIKNLAVKRKVTRIQLHHTYSPSYKHFDGKNHEALQKGMRNYHVNTNGWADIGQHFTIFPDGIIFTGRSIESTPAGIYGANTGSICIECLGNFDAGGDIMKDSQKNAIIGVTKILLNKFNLTAEDNVTYHAWWTSGGKKLGDYIKGSSSKTCPGTAFFGGNSRESYEKNLLPLIKNYDASGKSDEVTEINDIVWELSNAGIVTDAVLWIKKCNEDINVYWLCRKMANRIKMSM